MRSWLVGERLVEGDRLRAASDQELDRAAGLEAGAVGFLSKPIDGRTLVATVRELLKEPLLP